MSMAIVKLGFSALVMPTQKAVALAEIISEAEVYEYHYVKDKSGETVKTQHIYPNEFESTTMELISDTQYKMYKLAGKPKEA